MSDFEFSFFYTVIEVGTSDVWLNCCHYIEVLVCLGNVTVEIWLTNEGFIFNEI